MRRTTGSSCGWQFNGFRRPCQTRGLRTVIAVARRNGSKRAVVYVGSPPLSGPGARQYLGCALISWRSTCVRWNHPLGLSIANWITGPNEAGPQVLRSPVLRRACRRREANLSVRSHFN